MQKVPLLPDFMFCVICCVSNLISMASVHWNVVLVGRKRNPDPPKNRYMVVLYSCIAGFTLKDPAVDRLLCSRGRWVGPRPVCISAGGKLSPQNLGQPRPQTKITDKIR